MKNHKDFLNWNEFQILENFSNYIDNLEKFCSDYKKISFKKAFKKLF